MVFNNFELESIKSPSEVIGDERNKTAHKGALKIKRVLPIRKNLFLFFIK